MNAAREQLRQTATATRTCSRAAIGTNRASTRASTSNLAPGTPGTSNKAVALDNGSSASKPNRAVHSTQALGCLSFPRLSGHLI
jgi:hypothetical protein